MEDVNDLIFISQPTVPNFREFWVGSDHYIDTLTNTITSAIAEKVPTKSIKQNSIGVPIEIRELLSQKRHQRRLWQKTRIPQYKTNANRLHKRISKDITIGETAGK